MKPHSIRLAEVLIFLYLGCVAALTAAPQEDQNTAALLSTLKAQGVPEEAILGIDANGIPRVCGGAQSSPHLAGSGPSLLGVLPPGIRSWECIPNVIRNDTNDWFPLEVDVNETVDNVRWTPLKEYYITTESGTNTVWLRDDGLGGDRVAGDNIYTSERCRYRIELPMRKYYSSNALAGVYISNIGTLYVAGTGSSQFLIPPSLAVISTNIPPVETVMLASNLQVSAHFLNLMTTNRNIQRVLRMGGGSSALFWPIYDALPDAFDFLTFFSTDHIEYNNHLASANFTLGKFAPVSQNFTGNGSGTFNYTAAYGSAGRLKGISMLDIMERGIETSDNAAHEISHQWSAYITTSLNITTGAGHYHRNSGMDSILGGLYKPVTNQTGGIIRQCSMGDHWEATPLDKYMMGLISSSSVPAIFVSSNILDIACDGVITNLRPMVTISNIIAAHGVRTPGPESSQKDFRIGFAAGSHNRLLTATEMTFYDLLAAHFTKMLPTNHAAPNLNDAWVPITKFFGEGSTWSSDVLNLIRPKITGMERMTNGFRLSGMGYPGRNYRLLATTNFVHWTTVTNTAATTNGTFTLIDSAQQQLSARYYCVGTP